MSPWFYAFLAILLIGFIMLIGVTVWAAYWSQGKISTNNSDPPTGMWAVFGIGTGMFVIGMIGIMFFLPYKDWYTT